MDGYPLHRLNTGHIRAWLCSPILRRQMADWLGRQYNTGVVVLSPTLRAFATVSPRGQIQSLPPPHRRYEFWQIANKPSLKYNECACRNYIDPETGGRWGERDKERLADIHHPFCQCRETAQAVFDRSYDSAMARRKDGLPAQARLDEWIRTTAELGGRTATTSGRS